MILGLDVATRTGWATDDRRHGLIDLSSWAGDWPAMGGAFEFRVGQLVGEVEPSVVVIEKPFARGANTYLLMGLCFSAGVIARRAGARILMPTCWDVRGLLLGDKCAGKGQVMAWARSEGFDPADDNEADALALVAWAERA